MSTITHEQGAPLTPGQRVVVNHEGRVTTGRLIGFTREPGVPMLRVLGDDNLERRFPLPVQVSNAG